MKLKDLQDAGNAAVKEAREVAEKASAAGRDMSADERSIYDGAMAKGRQLLEQIKAVKADEAILDQARQLAKDIGDDAVADVDAQSFGAKDGGARERVKSLGLQVVESAQFKSMVPANGHIPNGTRVQSNPIPVKALIVGGSTTSAGAFVVTDRQADVEMLGRRALTIRDAISVRQTGSDSVEYVVQTSHVNNAAPVAEATTAAGRTSAAAAGPLVPVVGGGYKPEGSWVFAKANATVKTIAEWVPSTKRALSDVAALSGLIDQELRADLAEAEETQVLRGDGTGENLPGILTNPNIQSQVFVTDLFVTIRKALTKARTIGRVNPNAIGLNPADVETVDLARDTTGQFYGAGPFAMGPRTLWGVPILESEAFTAGQALVGDYKKAVLWDREQTSVTFSDSHDDFFIRNLVAILAEERVGFGVTRPTAFVKAALA